MKRPDLRPKGPRRDPPGNYSHFSDEQKDWLEVFKRLGWVTLVAYTADEALQALRAAGFGV